MQHLKIWEGQQVLAFLLVQLQLKYPSGYLSGVSGVLGLVLGVGDACFL